MANSTAKLMRGKVEVGRGATPVFTNLDSPRDYVLPLGTRAKLDATSHATAKGEMEYAPGRLDRGSFKVTVNFVPGSATDTCLSQCLASGEYVQLRLTADVDDEDVEPVVFAAFVESYAPNVQVKDLSTAEASFAVCGVVA